MQRSSSCEKQPCEEKSLIIGNECHIEEFRILFALRREYAHFRAVFRFMEEVQFHTLYEVAVITLERKPVEQEVDVPDSVDMPVEIYVAIPETVTASLISGARLSRDRPAFSRVRVFITIHTVRAYPSVLPPASAMQKQRREK